MVMKSLFLFLWEYFLIFASLCKAGFFFWIYQFFGTDLAFKRIDNIFTALLFLFFFSCWYGLQNTWTKHQGFNNSTKKCKPLLPCVEMHKETSWINAGFIIIPKCCSYLIYFAFWGKITNSLLTITYSNRTLQSNIFFLKSYQPGSKDTCNSSMTSQQPFLHSDGELRKKSARNTGNYCSKAGKHERGEYTEKLIKKVNEEGRDRENH